MSLGLFKGVIYKIRLYIYIKHMLCKRDLSLNNLQVWYAIKPNQLIYNPKSTKNSEKTYENAWK